MTKQFPLQACKKLTAIENNQTKKRNLKTHCVHTIRVTLCPITMCYTCVNIFICPTFTHLYLNDIYRGNVEIFVLGPLPCDQGKCLSFTFTNTWIINFANFM
jgi:hypothetical protein